ncbi:MAG: hypothetical protein JST00_23705 [Deltaproteobacteria bacterium]|nr:hypothetical protein [Deltaproteobacteria bacterium]
MGSFPVRAAVFVLLALGASTTGCVQHLPPPPAPAKTMPEVEVASTAPPAGQARVILDVEGEKAWVSRVTGTTAAQGYKVDEPIRASHEAVPSNTMRTDELLCVTPCAIDLRAGAHEFVFARPESKGHETTATIVAPSGSTTVVRHAIGRTPHYSSPYIGGAALFLLGSGFTAIGGLATGVGAAIPSTDSSGQRTGSDALLTIGVVVLAVGVVTGGIGLGMLLDNRPTEQPGATTTWTRP